MDNSRSNSERYSVRKHKRTVQGYRDSFKRPLPQRVWKKVKKAPHRVYPIDSILQVQRDHSSLQQDSLREDILARVVHVPQDPHFISNFTALDPHVKAFKVQLNKLTPSNMQPICASLLELLNVAGPVQFCKLLIDKASAELKYSETYAELCIRLVSALPGFKKDLINCCQVTFEGLSTETDRKRLQGKVKFIGCLINNGLIPRKVLKTCLEALETEGGELNVEAACYLLGTCNWVFGQLKEWVHCYIRQLEFKATKFPPRVKFQVQDLKECQQLKMIEFSKQEVPTERNYR